jgi:hypothetical protein
MSDDRAGSRVAAVLEGLALQNASGELEIDGSPGGAIYLDRGEVTFARSAWSPDLATRLHGALGPVAGLRDLLAAEDRPAGDLGSQLVRRGYLAADQLESIIRSVALDAIIVLTVPLSDEAAISGIRLVAGVSHWAAEYCRLNVAAVRAEAVRRGARMADLELGRGARLHLRDLAAGSAVLTSRQWQLACMMDGSTTARDLAWDNGLPLYETAESVGALVSAGLCTAVPVPAAAPVAVLDPRAAKAGPQPKVVSGLAPGRVTARGVTTRARLPKATGGSNGQGSGVRPVMPRRRPGSAEAIASGAEMQPDCSAEADSTPVSIESLRRVLDGLRRLS